MPSPAKPLGLPDVGFTTPPQPRFAPTAPSADRVQPSGAAQEWQWVPSLRFVGILLGLAALVIAGVWLYETSRSISMSDLWPSQSATQTPESSEPVPDAHPRALSQTPRGAVGAPRSKNEPGATPRATDRQVVTVLAAPPSTDAGVGSPAQPPAAANAARPRGTVPSNSAGAATESGSAVAFIAATHIYSALDDDVTPPETLYPQKLGNLKTGTLTADDRVTIEVVVNDHGIVEAAWGRTSPRTVGESLLLATSLHAVKSWAFRPALKNGNPVAYRKLITFQGY
jgi:hypothetical protein